MSPARARVLEAQAAERARLDAIRQSFNELHQGMFGSAYMPVEAAPKAWPSDRRLVHRCAGPADSE
jgi:hypothetical protein